MVFLRESLSPSTSVLPTLQFTPWERSGDKTLLHSIEEVLQSSSVKSGRALFSASVNFGGGPLASAVLDPVGFKKLIRDRLRYSLSKIGVPASDWAAVLELDPDGRPHAHLFILADAGAECDLAHALRAAAGKWSGKAGKRYQVDIRPHFPGWAQYLSKAVVRTSKALGVKSVVIAANDLRSAGKAYWDDLRRQAREPIPITLPGTRKSPEKPAQAREAVTAQSAPSGPLRAPVTSPANPDLSPAEEAALDAILAELTAGERDNPDDAPPDSRCPCGEAVCPCGEAVCPLDAPSPARPAAVAPPASSTESDDPLLDELERDILAMTAELAQLPAELEPVVEDCADEAPD
ncbi:MAG: hypothetical protein AB7F96_05210 [Beijerinckiaceae bacterium]